MTTTAAQIDHQGVVEACPNCGQRNRVPLASLGGLAKCGRCSTSLPSLASPVDIGDETSFDVLVSSARLPVLVDFWAEWCGPCKMMAPELHRLASDSAGKVIIGKVNTETAPALAQRFQITAIPTLVLFLSGTEKGRLQGARPASQIQPFIARFGSSPR